MIRIRRLLVWAAIAALASGAPRQSTGTPAVPLEIRGVVLEPGANLPIAGAEVWLFGQMPGPLRINGGWNTDSSAKVRTDDSGAFTLALDSPGAYRVSARKAGFIAPGASGGAEYAEVTLTAGKPAAPVKLFLARSGRLTGMVVDEDTGKPIVHLRLGAVKPATRAGWPAESSATTDGKGEFEIADLPPGEYEVEIRPQIDQEQRVLSQFTAKDTQTVERDFERTYWPGGHGKDTAMPVTVASGATVYVGQLPVRKVAYYRVHLRIPASGCKAGDRMYFAESTAAMGQHLLTQTTPCGQDVLVTGFAPETYRLTFGVGDLSASVPFTIVDKNLEIAAPLTPGFPVDGAFVAADGAKPPDWTKTGVSLRALENVGSPAPAKPDAEGKFRLERARPSSYVLTTFGIGAGNYVKEIRYNGRALAADVVPLDDGAVAHTLTIVVDDKPAAISGVVVSRGEPVSRPVVIARKWPLNGSKGLMGWAGAQGDENGRFQITGLGPGEYRVIALRSLNRDMTSGTPALERALAEGQKVEIGPNGFQNVTVEVSELP
jgi:hypothetical protein